MKMKRISASMFLAVIFCFSAAVLVFSLLASIKLAALNDTAARLRAETAELAEENRSLTAQYEQSISIDEIERYAVEELGMRRCTPEQIEYIDISKYIETSEQTG